MQTARVKNSLNFFLQRTFVFYLFVFILLHFVLNFNKMERKSTVAALNRVRPYSLYLIEISTDPLAKTDKRKINEHRRYFEQVEKLYPGRSDTSGMLGFCYYYLQNYPKALAYYKKAQDKDPDIYVFSYNRGLIEFKQHKYTQAIDTLTQAFPFKAEASIGYIMNSIVYRQILSEGEVPVSGKDLAYKIREKIQDVYLMLALSYFEINDYSKALYFAQQLKDIDGGLRKDVSLWLTNAIMVKTRQYPQAIGMSKNILEQNAQFIKVYDNLIESLEAVGQKAAAENIRQAKNNIKSPYDPLSDFIKQLHAQIY